MPTARKKPAQIVVETATPGEERIGKAQDSSEERDWDPHPGDVASKDDRQHTPVRHYRAHRLDALGRGNAHTVHSGR